MVATAAFAARVAGRRGALPRLPLLQQMGLVRLHLRLLRRRLPEPVHRLWWGGGGGGGGGGDGDGDGVASIISQSLFDQMLKHRNNAVSVRSGPASPGPGKRYYGRGPIQLSWNYNYGQAGAAISVDLLSDPAGPGGPRRRRVLQDGHLVLDDAAAAKPSSHDVITGQWSPSAADVAAGRLPGYGVITNIINGGLECGRGPDDRVDSRIRFFKHFCDMLGISYGDNLDCYRQTAFGSGTSW
ncbi:hypothetical protein C2845_PM10G21810 [Panicum miliaceum]|uniref:chitinase n=1 Tax=Panicum miliaceum TaxID=4540 RepID=A0A3L6PDU1_PANMI|nr:hypothetical protein C2845_PM10G21810 [Panicum miliaceum]